MILIMILLYMLDLRKPLLIPVAILIVTVIIFLISPEIYEVTHKILLYSLGFIPIVGFFYLTFKNKDVKSLSMVIHFIFLTAQGMVTLTNPLLGGIFILISAIVIALGILGVFDKLIEYVQKENTAD